MAGPRHEVGRELARLRLGRGWSQVALVRRLRQAARARGTSAGVNDEMISRWENGHRRPHPFYRILIEDLLGLPRERWEEGHDDVERREFLGTVGGAALSGVAVPGATLSRLLGMVAAPPVDDERLEAWRADVESFQARYETTPPTELLEPVATRLRVVTSLLRSSQSPATRQRLQRLGAELAGLRGRLAFHLDESDTTGLWHEVALSLATEADERLLAGWVLGSHSLVALYAGDEEQASSLLRRGLALTAGSPSSPTRAWLLGLTARTQAARGRRDQARQTLRAAREATAPAAPGERRHPMGFDDRDLVLHFHEGVSSKLVGDFVRAEEALDAGFARRPEERGYRRSAAVYRLEKADLLLRRGEPDSAAHLATKALETVQEDEVVVPVTRRLIRLRRGLAPFRDAAAVRRLEDTWAAVGA